MAVFLSMYVLSVVAFFIHLYTVESKDRTFGRVIELLLLYQIVFNIGMTSLLAFIGLTFIPDYIAQYVGWPASPFQQELGNVNLSFGVLGTLAIWLRGNFWTATVLGFSIWIFADGIHHIAQILWRHNYAPGNVGIPLETDLVVPVVVVILLALHLKFNS